MDDIKPVRDDLPFDPDQTWKTDLVDADATWPVSERRSPEPRSPRADDVPA